MKNYVLAHDLGTTGNKATLYDREGRYEKRFRIFAAAYQALLPIYDMLAEAL